MLAELDAVHTFFNIYGISSQTLQEEGDNEEFKIMFRRYRELNLHP